MTENIREIDTDILSKTGRKRPLGRPKSKRKSIKVGIKTDRRSDTHTHRIDLAQYSDQRRALLTVDIDIQVL
jgi:hypothetical protein